MVQFCGLRIRFISFQQRSEYYCTVPCSNEMQSNINLLGMRSEKKQNSMQTQPYLEIWFAFQETRHYVMTSEWHDSAVRAIRCSPFICYEDNRDTQISPVQSLLLPFQYGKHKKCTEPDWNKPLLYLLKTSSWQFSLTLNIFLIFICFFIPARF